MRAHGNRRWRLDDGCCMDCGIPLPGVFELWPGSWGRHRQPVRLHE
jgi:pyruvate formate lyase activating enzyme